MQNNNPLVTDPLDLVRMAKNSILKKEGIIEIIPYERRAYESVDESTNGLIQLLSVIRYMIIKAQSYLQSISLLYYFFCNKMYLLINLNKTNQKNKTKIIH